MVLSFLTIMFMCFFQADTDRKRMTAPKTQVDNTEEASLASENAEIEEDTETADEPDPDIRTVTKEGGFFKPEDDEEKPSYDAPTAETLENEPFREENEYGDLLLNRYDFEGKRIAFFGDSITFGATVNGGFTKNTYPKLFCEKVNAEYDNFAKGGSSFTGGGNEPASIVEVVKNTDLSYDYLIIAGGANDCGNYHSVESMETALNELCLYLKEKFTGTDIIFITPTPNGYFESEPNEESRLYPYRQAIARIAEENGFSYINGDQMVIEDPDSENTDIHPTEEGYVRYADELYKRLAE